MVLTVGTWAAQLAAAGATIDQRAAPAVMKAAHDVEAHAKTLVPVDTGATRNSISPTPLRAIAGGIETEVGPETEYAPHLERGTSRMAPRPFMGPAADAVMPSFAEAVVNIGGDI